MDIKQALYDEIRRLARKEIKAALAPMQETIGALKKQVAEQKRQIAVLGKCCAPAVAEAAPAAPKAAAADKRVRINAAGIQRLRNKLGLTQSEFAKAIGVAMHTVSVWEQGRRVPRQTQKVRICALRNMGKREIKKLLAQPAPAEK
jgi:DNA-binding transcriptional regulator YiaG